MADIEPQETIDPAKEWDLTHGVGPTFAPPDTLGAGQVVDPSLQGLLSGVLGGGRPSGSVFDPLDSERQFGDQLNETTAMQASEMVEKNLKTEGTGGLLTDRPDTAANGKVENVLSAIDRRDSLYLSDNKGKLMGVMAGTILQMVGLNNNAPGLFLAGGTVSSLAQNELQKWNDRWDAQIAKELETPDTRTTHALKTSIADAAQEAINENKGPAKSEARARVMLRGKGLEETPENLQLMMTGEAGADIKESEALKKDKVDAIIKQSTPMMASEWKATGELEVIRGEDREVQKERVRQWYSGKALGDVFPNTQLGLAEEGKTALDLISLDETAVDRTVDEMFGEGVRKKTGVVAPGDARDRARDQALATESSELSGFYVDASGIPGKSDEDVLATPVEVSEDMVNEVPLLNNISPGPREYGEVIASIADTLPNEAVVIEDKDTGRSFLYVYTEPTVFRPQQSASVPIPRSLGRARNKVKVLARSVDPNDWRIGLQQTIDTGSGYDSQYESYIRMLSTSMRGAPGGQ